MQAETVLATSDTARAAQTYYNAALSNTKIEVSDFECNFYGFVLYNAGSAVTFLQVFDKDADDVTVGTTIPDVAYPIPAGGGLDQPVIVPIRHMGVGFTVAATTTATGSTAPGTALHTIIYFDNDNS